MSVSGKSALDTGPSAADSTAGVRVKSDEEKGFFVGKIRAGHDYACALHKGPKGNCNPWNCKCY